jgi:hydroxyacylglutathione hydrolase
MLLERFFDEKLAQTSWLVGCQATGEAIVIDPNRDINQYLELAAKEGLEIQHVTETHIHADFVSGVRELAARTGATMYLSDQGGADWRYGYLDDGRSVRLEDGDVFMVGNVRFEVWHTPGHTPEHVVFVITDSLTADEPVGAFTGDFLFVGDVGRPDLLEKAAGVAGTMDGAARQLFASIRRFRDLPDWLQIWPGHGAGSACGKALGAVPQSTLGYEKRFNWAFKIDDEDEFVQAVLEGQPEPPRYFAEMKRINRDGPRVLGSLPRPLRQDDACIVDVIDGGSLVVDTRRGADFSQAHVPGTISIPLNRSFTTWAGSLVPYDRPFHLLIDAESAPHALAEAVHDLSMIGLDRIAGWFNPGAVTAWAAAGRTLGTLETIEADGVEAALENRTAEVIDVRGRSEWEAGHLPGVRNIPLTTLTDRLSEIPRDRPIVLHCQSGNRSVIASSVLRAHGFDKTSNYAGGFSGWSRAGRPVHRAGESLVDDALRSK